MRIRLEKIAPIKNQRRFYDLSVALNLFGEWALVKEWGRIGSKGGQRRTEWHTSAETALEALSAAKLSKERRGYVARPVQLWLPL